MKLNGVLVVAALALFAAGISRADVVPGHFTINLNDNPTDTSQGIGGWLSEHEFDVTVNPDIGTGGFENPICTNYYGQVVSYGEECSAPEGDPTIQINGGGESTPLPASFNSDENGGGFFDFLNAGPDPITSLLITAQYDNSTNFFTNGFFQCSSDIFSFCGFQTEQDDTTLNILFANGTIPVAAPEPSYSLVFLVAAGMLIWVRKARQSKRA